MDLIRMSMNIVTLSMGKNLKGMEKSVLYH